MLCLEHALVVVHQAVDLVGELQGEGLQPAGLAAVHHHGVGGVVQGSLESQENRAPITKPAQCQISEGWSTNCTHHELFINDHFADDGMHHTWFKLKGFSQSCHRDGVVHMGVGEKIGS